MFFLNVFFVAKVSKIFQVGIMPTQVIADRTKTKTVKIGSLVVGSKYPIRIKGMLKTPTGNISRLIKEAKLLEDEGAEAIRIAVKEEKDAGLAVVLKRHVKPPLVSDIHFHYRLALRAIEQGFDAVRLNPLNIYKSREVGEVASLAKRYKVSIRIGVNSGGFKKNFASPIVFAQRMVKEVENYIRILEKKNFFDIMVSFKAADIPTTILANRIFRKKFDYPLHLGITATGSFLDGVTKSSLGIGMLLGEGIGDIIRVSLTAPSYWEIRAAKSILQALELRRFGFQVISCPTCSRCEVNLVKLVEDFTKKLKDSGFNKPIRIALMGCVVNGPGEARQADIGVAFGKKKAAIFRKDKILAYSGEKNIITDLINETWALFPRSGKNARSRIAPERSKGV